MADKGLVGEVDSTDMFSVIACTSCAGGRFSSAIWLSRCNCSSSRELITARTAFNTSIESDRCAMFNNLRGPLRRRLSWSSSKTHSEPVVRHVGHGGGPGAHLIFLRLHSLQAVEIFFLEVESLGRFSPGGLELCACCWLAKNLSLMLIDQNCMSAIM